MSLVDGAEPKNGAQGTFLLQNGRVIDPRNGIDLRVFKIHINAHLHVFQNQIPCHFSQNLRSPLIFPAARTAHIPLTVIALKRSHSFSPDPHILTILSILSRNI